MKNGTKPYFEGVVHVKGQSLVGPRTVFSALQMLVTSRCVLVQKLHSALK